MSHRIKKASLKTASVGLIAPQIVLAGTGAVLGATEYGIRKIADGVGYLKTKSYDGEAYIADLRHELNAKCAALDAEIEAELRKQVKLEIKAQKAQA